LSTAWGFTLHEEVVFDRTTTDRAESSTGWRLNTHELSDDISSLLVRGVASDIDVLHNDIRLASGFEGTIYLGDLEGRASLRIDLLIEILLGFRLARCYREPIFDEELPVLRDIRKLPDTVTILGAGCDNVIWLGRLGISR
jgi:hypothetical protein